MGLRLPNSGIGTATHRWRSAFQFQPELEATHVTMRRAELDDLRHRAAQRNGMLQKDIDRLRQLEAEEEEDGISPPFRAEHAYVNPDTIVVISASASASARRVPSPNRQRNRSPSRRRRNRSRSRSRSPSRRRQRNSPTPRRRRNSARRK